MQSSAFLADRVVAVLHEHYGSLRSIDCANRLDGIGKYAHACTFAWPRLSFFNWKHISLS
jgi:hypothetical protein